MVVIYSLSRLPHMPSKSRYHLLQSMRGSQIFDVCKTFRDPQKNHRKAKDYLLHPNSELTLLQRACSFYKAFFSLFLNKAEAILNRFFSVPDISTKWMFLKFLFFSWNPFNLVNRSLCTAFNYFLFCGAK